MIGTIGRSSRQLRLEVCQRTDKATLTDWVLQTTQPLSVTYTDEWKGYTDLPTYQRVHRTVNHGKKEWAKDNDDDGIRETHTNTIEGIWTGLRKFLRTFRGVAKKNLHQYCAIFEWYYNTKTVSNQFIQALCFSSNQLTT